MKLYWFELETPIIPYVRMTRRGKFVNPRAQAYLINQTAIKAELHNAMIERGYKEFFAFPLDINVLFLVDHGLHRCDLDNQLKAVIDAMQHIVFHNDCWIDMISTQRALVTKAKTYIEIGIIGEKYDGQD